MFQALLAAEACGLPPRPGQRSSHRSRRISSATRLQVKLAVGMLRSLSLPPSRPRSRKADRSRQEATSGVCTGDLVGDSFDSFRPPNFGHRMLLRSGCNVLWIGSGGHTELHGALSPALRISEAPGPAPQRHTKVSGDLAVLASCKKLQILDLSRTNVARDVKALRNLTAMSRQRRPRQKKSEGPQESGGVGGTLPLRHEGGR